MITVEGLTKRYGSHLVLNQINTRFERGMVYGIVGENGAGKTTLFRCIAGLEKYEGRVRSDFPGLKDHLGFLATDPYFFPRITGREYIRLLCTARGVRAEDPDACNIFGLPLGQYATTYSTGMKKKLALTAILMQHNDIFILDEPFNGVDIQSNLLIAAIIHKLKEKGRTMIISSHIFSTLGETCDVILLLKDGTIIKSVTRDDFVRLEKEMTEASIEQKTGMLDFL